MITIARAGRPPHRREELVAELKRRIIQGELPLGSRLPNRHQLTRQFNVANPTVHDALQRLIRDGFVETKGTKGTFVAQTPPHLCAYGLVMPRLFNETRFLRAMSDGARAVFASESRRLRVYDWNVNNSTDPTNLKLIDDVASHRLAGMILIWPTNEFAGLSLNSPDSGPRVVIGAPPGPPGVPTLAMNLADFYERAVDRLLLRGRRKIACIGIGSDEFDNDKLTPILRRRGLETRPYWNMPLGLGSFSSAQPAAHLLASLSPADRPDGLVISDDNLVEHAQAGLVAAGVRSGQDLDVIAHCNWPTPPANVLPLIFLGFDGVGMMRTCAKLIDEQRRGLTVPQCIHVGPLFEEELPAAVEADALMSAERA